MRSLFQRTFLFIAAVAMTIGVAIAQEIENRDVVVKAEELTSSYGAPPDQSHGRLSTLTKSYVLPPFHVELENIYEGDIFRNGAPVHLFTQEVEMGLPFRFTAGIQNQVERFSGDTTYRSFVIEARYALANYNKIPLNPTLTGEYRFGFNARHDAADLGLLFSHDFPHLIEWAFNVSGEKELRSDRNLAWNFAQSVEVPVLLPEEKLEVGLEMQYRHRDDVANRNEEARGLTIGPTLAWRPTKTVRFDVSPLFGCTHEAPRLQVFAAFSISFGGPEAGEAETPTSARSH